MREYHVPWWACAILAIVLLACVVPSYDGSQRGLAVSGWRRLPPGGLFSKESWIELEYRYAASGTFRYVTANVLWERPRILGRRD